MSVLLVGALLALAAPQHAAGLPRGSGCRPGRGARHAQGRDRAGPDRGRFRAARRGRLRRLEPVLEEQAPVDAVLVARHERQRAGPEAGRAEGCGSGLPGGSRGRRERRAPGLPGGGTPAGALHPRPRPPPSGAGRRPARRQHGPLRRRLRRAAPPRAGPPPHGHRGLQRRGRQLSWLAASEVVEAASRSDAIVYAVAVRDRGSGASPSCATSSVPPAAGFRGGERARPPGTVPRRPRRHPLPLRAELRASRQPTRPAGTRWRCGSSEAKGDVLARPGYWRYATVAVGDGLRRGWRIPRRPARPERARDDESVPLAVRHLAGLDAHGHPVLGRGQRAGGVRREGAGRVVGLVEVQDDLAGLRQVRVEEAPGRRRSPCRSSGRAG